MTRDNLFNLEQYSKGTIYQLCQTLLHDPTAQRDQLRTILAYVNEVIDANWVTPRRFRDLEATSELVSIIENPTAFASLELSPTEFNEARYILLKTCVDEIYASHQLEAGEFKAPTQALSKAFNTLPQRIGPSFTAMFVKELYDCKSFFSALIPFCIQLLSMSNQLRHLIEKLDDAQALTDAQRQSLTQLFEDTTTIVAFEKASIFVVIFTIIVCITVCAMRRHKT